MKKAIKDPKHIKQVIIEKLDILKLLKEIIKPHKIFIRKKNHLNLILLWKCLERKDFSLFK